MTELRSRHLVTGSGIPQYLVSLTAACRLSWNASRSTSASRSCMVSVTAEAERTHPVLLDARPGNSFEVSAKTSYRPLCPHPLSPQLTVAACSCVLVAAAAASTRARMHALACLESVSVAVSCCSLPCSCSCCC